MRIAINGFGRIGKSFLRALLLDPRIQKKVHVVGINTGGALSPYTGHLFAYDTVMGSFSLPVEQKNDVLCVAGMQIPLLNEQFPENLPWKKLGVDWVIECSGKFTTQALAQQHIQAGAKKILISAPADDADFTAIPGVNNTHFNTTKHTIISLGSCTTNCFAPLVKVLHESLEIVSGMMTTVHAYTNDQVVLDVAHKDPRRARAAASNIIPTKTGAEKTIVKIYPELEGKIKAQALRVPVANASMIDFTVLTKKSTDRDTLNALFKKATTSTLQGTLDYTELPLVSSDFIGNPHAAIVDGLLTQSLGTLSRVCAWYDNEFGYASQMKEFLLHLS